jgi:hypothetical protein
VLSKIALAWPLRRLLATMRLGLIPMRTSAGVGKSLRYGFVRSSPGMGCSRYTRFELNKLVRNGMLQKV